ncbi:galactose oxidase-like domain-containing protein [Nocardia amamiensis]|uniref:galactose oxidase-like domain-containing protein n=1 Tax=Nocardia amamiensis TaxID=404578 RepID=UPI0033D5D225
MPWEIVTNNSEILAIHASLLPTNQVLMFGGSEHNAAQNQSGNPIDLDNTRLFNLSGGTLIEPVGSPDTDVFCSGHACLSDGRILVGGGTAEWGGEHEGHGHDLNFLGEHACWVYHPRARRWRRARDFNLEPGEPDGGGRWYPTLVTLANGDVLAVAGHPFETDSRHNNDTPERFSSASDIWTSLTAERLDAGVRTRYYPRFHLLPDGNVFFVSPVSGACRVYNPFTGVTIGATIPGPGGGLYENSWDFPSVLLPLLPTDAYKPRVMICGDVNPRKIDLSIASPTWQNTAARSGAAAGKQRRFACAVILPTGEVFVSGGVNGGNSDTNGVRDGEIYNPGIDWSTGQFTLPDSWATVEASTVVRNYHSTALLLPNGRVWVAGSSKNAAQGDPATVGELRIEVFKPAYDAATNRPQLTNVPPSAGYGQVFEIGSPQAAQIRRVAVTRCGSVTHAFDGDQRYVGLNFDVVQGNSLRVTAPPNSRIAPPGYYLLWIVDASGRPCEQAAFIRVCSQRLITITDRSTFSTHEVQALGTPATFTNALYVVLDGFLPSEAGSPPVTPTITFTRPDGSIAPGMTAQLNSVDYEDDTVPPDIAQRITFVFNIRFTSQQAFNEIPAADPAQNIALTARHGANSGQATLVLSKNPNPYMRDGQVHWLSTDLRVFTMRPGQTRAGLTHGSGDGASINFIQALLGHFNATPTDEDHPFFDISPDLEESQLELASQAGGQSVFNFSVAKVRYRAPATINADDVKVLFRLFTTVATGLAFNTASYPRQGDGATAAPLLGMAGGEIVSIPFFAEARQADMRTQPDATNVHDLAGAGAAEVTAYFGCWLDFNQPTPRYPLNPPHNGSGDPFSGTLLSIQQLVRNHHCCLVAEIHYPLDPIPNGATPGSNDNLSQRNIVVVDSDNPGAAHTVQSTFEIKPSVVPVRVPQAFGAFQDVPPPQQGPPPALPGVRGASPAATGIARDTFVAQRIDNDELMIRWHNLPRDSRVSLYLPDIDVDQVVAAAASRNGPHVLTARQDKTLVCTVGDVTYIPIPGPRALNIPGLLSIELPPTVVKGQKFAVTAHQVSGYPRRIIGSFQLTVPVHTADEILPAEVRKLSVLRHIGLSIPTGNRWRPVWDRYLDEIADRVEGLGVNPDEIAPSPTGERRPQPPDKPDRRAVTGKVRRLLYDCFGEFEGFVLETCDGERTFLSCARGTEDVVWRACDLGLTVTVEFTLTQGKKMRILKLALLCC